MYNQQLYNIEVLCTKDNSLTSYICYKSWASLERISTYMTSKRSLEQTTSIVTQAIVDQFCIKDMDCRHLSSFFPAQPQMQIRKTHPLEGTSNNGNRYTRPTKGESVTVAQPCDAPLVSKDTRWQTLGTRLE